MLKYLQSWWCCALWVVLRFWSDAAGRWTARKRCTSSHRSSARSWNSTSRTVWWAYPATSCLPSHSKIKKRKQFWIFLGAVRLREPVVRTVARSIGAEPVWLFRLGRQAGAGLLQVRNSKFTLRLVINEDKLSNNAFLAEAGPVD